MKVTLTLSLLGMAAAYGPSQIATNNPIVRNNPLIDYSRPLPFSNVAPVTAGIGEDLSTLPPPGSDLGGSATLSDDNPDLLPPARFVTPNRMPFFEDRPISSKPLTYGGLDQASILTIKQHEERSELREIKLQIQKLLVEQKTTLSKVHPPSSTSSKPFPLAFIKRAKFQAFLQLATQNLVGDRGNQYMSAQRFTKMVDQLTNTQFVGSNIRDTSDSKPRFYPSSIIEQFIRITLGLSEGLTGKPRPVIDLNLLIGFLLLTLQNIKVEPTQGRFLALEPLFPSPRTTASEALAVHVQACRGSSNPNGSPEIDTSIISQFTNAIAADYFDEQPKNLAPFTGKLVPKDLFLGLLDRCIVPLPGSENKASNSQYKHLIDYLYKVNIPQTKEELQGYSVVSLKMLETFGRQIRQPPVGAVGSSSSQQPATRRYP